MLGGLELLFIVIMLGTLGTFVWSLVDVLSRPEHQWKAIRQERFVWVLVHLFAGFAGTLVYQIAIRPKLTRAALAPIPAHPMLAAAPPGWYPDPQGSGMLRWFDGMQWTQAFAPPGSVPMGGAPMVQPSLMGGSPMGQPPQGPAGYYR